MKKSLLEKKKTGLRPADRGAKIAEFPSNKKGSEEIWISALERGAGSYFL
jgi:hypothetical protein